MYLLAFFPKCNISFFKKMDYSISVIHSDSGNYSHHPTPACQCIASCFIGGHGPNRCFAKQRYCPVYYDGWNDISRHAEYVDKMDYALIYFGNYPS